MTFRFAALDALPPDSKMRAFFAESAREHGLEFSAPAENREAERGSATRGVQALVTRRERVSRDVMDECGTSLRAVHVQGRLPDRVDLPETRRRGIVVATMPSLGCIAVAEHTMALILALARKVVPSHAATISGAYESLGVTPAKTSESVIAFNWMKVPDVAQIYGKTLGVVGLGEIGQELARRARAFEMRVLYWRRQPLDPDSESSLGVEYRDSLNGLLAEADVVSLLVPHTSSTERMMGADQFARMRRGALFVNTARGGLVDEEALCAAVESGRLGGVGLDVFDSEPLPKGHPFSRLTPDQAVLTAHIGGGTGGGHRRHVSDVVANLARFARGEPMRNVVP
jgi:phosphoglycerate dehydrogenase-like enzyme